MTSGDTAKSGGGEVKIAVVATRTIVGTAAAADTSSSSNARQDSALFIFLQGTGLYDHLFRRF